MIWAWHEESGKWIPWDSCHVLDLAAQLRHWTKYGEGRKITYTSVPEPK